MTGYERGKERARALAFDFIRLFEDGAALSYGDIANWQDRLGRMARRYGLVNEFRDNGIM